MAEPSQWSSSNSSWGAAGAGEKVTDPKKTTYKWVVHEVTPQKGGGNAQVVTTFSNTKKGKETGSLDDKNITQIENVDDERVAAETLSWQRKFLSAAVLAGTINSIVQNILNDPEKALKDKTEWESSLQDSIKKFQNETKWPPNVEPTQHTFMQNKEWIRTTIKNLQQLQSDIVQLKEWLKTANQTYAKATNPDLTELKTNYGGHKEAYEKLTQRKQELEKVYTQVKEFLKKQIQAGKLPSLSVDQMKALEYMGATAVTHIEACEKFHQEIQTNYDTWLQTIRTKWQSIEKRHGEAGSELSYLEAKAFPSGGVWAYLSDYFMGGTAQRNTET